MYDQSETELRTGSWNLVWEVVRDHPWLILVGLVLVAADRAAALVLPGSLALVIDRVLSKGEMSVLPLIIAAVVLATLVQAVTGYLLNMLLGHSSQRLVAFLRARVQAHILHLPLQFFDSHPSGLLTAQIMRDPEAVRDVLGTSAVSTASAIFTGLLAFGFMMILNARLTLAMSALLAIFAAATRWMARNIRPQYAKIADLFGAMSGRLAESIAGVRVVKAYAAETREALVFSAHSKALEEANVRVQRSQARISTTSSLVFTLIGVSVLYGGVLQIAVGALSIGRLVSYCALLAYSTQAARQLGGIGNQFALSLAGLDRIASVLGQRREDVDPRQIHVPDVRGVLRVEHVDFGYASHKNVLHDISFTAAPGVLTALVGASGSGKSTLCALLCGFYRPTSGAVWIDDVELASIRLGEYRNQLGVVFQETFLFTGTIRENVLIAKPNATEKELVECYKLSHLDRFVDRLVDGYETRVGERGVSLSGGERQRICMARAFLRNPQLLLLDEPTSSLDEESEQYFKDSLGRLTLGRTIIVVAHRLSTIQSADQILVLDGGRIVERGRHASLMAARGHYFRLFQSQLGRSHFVSGRNQAEVQTTRSEG